MESLKTSYPLCGTFGMICTSSAIATAVGMGVLERGGNAFDAAVSAALAMQVVMPDQNGPAGEVAAVFYSRREEAARVLCGQGVAPASATAAQFESLDLTHIPRTGLLAAVTPGAFDAWLLLLREYGTLSLHDAFEPAIRYARRGYPLLPRTVAYLAKAAKLFRQEWTTSAASFLRNGDVPQAGELFENRPLAGTFQRVCEEAASASRDRDRQIDAARRIFATGFVAEIMDRFARRPVMDSSGSRHSGLLTGDDIAAWRATIEPPCIADYEDLTLAKPGPWSQGPVFLQQLQLLRGFELRSLDPCGADFVHLVAEAAKLAFADKGEYYGDPAFAEVPMAELLAEDYAMSRRRLIDLRQASTAIRPGRLGGQNETLPPATARRVAAIGTPRDTAHIDVADCHGNMISATPSGGWFDESPIIAELGFPLSTRGQHFRLRPGHPNALAPRKRPLTTLSATIALRDGEPYMAFGTPGGDQQDQWSLIFLLRHLHGAMDIADANAAPMFHTRSFYSSYAPFKADPGRLIIEHSMPEATVAELRRRGHDIRIGGPPADHYAAQNFGTLSAIRRARGLLEATASGRWPYAYCAGR